MPLIRKFVITHKNEPEAPEFTALVREWDMTDRIAEADFTFEPPDGALKVRMLNQGGVAGTGIPQPTGSTQPRNK